MTTSSARTRVAAIAAVGAAGVLVTATGVYAVLQAQAFNTTPQGAGSGTLKLTLADNGAGLSQGISGLAPGDTVRRYVALTNGGTLDGRSLTLQVSDSVGSLLSTDATKGLQVAVDECSVAWTTTGAGSCTGTTTSLLESSPLSTVGATPQALGTGLMTAGQVRNLRLTVTLPDTNETTVNGTLPAGTVQGLSASLTWRFTEAQRTSSTTSS